MTKPTDKDGRPISRRAFLGTAAGSLLTKPGRARAQEAAQAAEAVPAPSAQQIERDTGNARPPSGPIRAAQRPGSDLMVQVLKDLGIEFVASNPGSSFEGLQESLVNYGEPPNAMPEFISAMHEESAVDMAHGYAKAEGKPMVALLHGTIGLQHASMAIYQAYHSQTPIVLLAGRDDTFFLQAHSANDIGGIVRATTKWDAHPRTLEESLLAIQQAYNEAITPPCGPTLVVLDSEVQKEEAGELQLPVYVPPEFPVISSTEAADIAASLLEAENPRISVGRLRTPAGIEMAVELAEMVGACTATSASRNAMSFPERHPLCGPGTDTSYDFALGLETSAADVSITGPHIRTIEDRDLAGIGYGFIRQDVEYIQLPQQRQTPSAKSITADAEASLPLIIDEVSGLLSSSRQREITDRRSRHGKANEIARAEALRVKLDQKRVGWEGSPISTARLYTELWPLIMDEDWCLSSPSIFSGGHHNGVWDHNKPYSYLGQHGAAGVGYGIGASTGAALAARDRGRIVINIQCDGDLNYAPGALWTAAHHRLPLLTIMHNNRAWHQELMFLQYMTGVRGRGTDRAHIGTEISDPNIDYATMAKAYGIASEGPISDPSMLADAFQRGIDSVKQGQPYLIDVLTQPR